MWLIVLRRYLFFSAAANLMWELAQLPLYTIWQHDTPAEIVFAAVHCTGGDILIALCSLVASLILTSNRGWPVRGYSVVAALAIAFGFSYAIFSEWLNTEVRHSWTYSNSMPRLPLVGTGLSPLMQWLLVPVSSFWLARYRLGKTDTI